MSIRVGVCAPTVVYPRSTELNGLLDRIKPEIKLTNDYFFHLDRTVNKFIEQLEVMECDVDFFAINSKACLGLKCRRGIFYKLYENDKFVSAALYDMH